MSLESTPSEGAISIDQAVGLLQGDDAPAAAVEREEPEQPQPEQDDASPQEAEDASEAEGPGDGGDEAETQEPAQPEVDAPPLWKAEHKELFAKADPQLRAALAEYETARESHFGRMKEETATARKAADAEATTYRNTLQALGQWLPQAVETFKSRWDGVSDADWAAFAQQNPEAYTKAKAQFDAESKQIAEAQKAHADGLKVQHAEALKAEAAKLPQYAPALADPKEGPKNKATLAKYLVESGVDAAMLPTLTAVALGLAWKAHLYDQGKAKLAAPKPTPQVPKAPVAPTAAQGRTSQQRSLEQLNARLNKSGAIGDAVAVLQARRK